MAAELVRRCGRPRELVLLDRSPQMLARAPAGLGRRELGDARALPFPDGRFDLVTMAFIVHLLPRDEAVAALAEAGRVLAPGGRVVLVSHSSPRGGPGRAYRRAWSLAGPLAAGGGPIEDAIPLLEAAGLRALREIRAPGIYWSQSLSAAP
jgi:ubiquinone/menaquinone biosynthesis C-methylase UbiE